MNEKEQLKGVFNLQEAVNIAASINKLIELTSIKE